MKGSFKTTENEGEARMRIRNDVLDALDDNLADENKWDSGKIINNFKRLHHCALSEISLLRLDKSHPTHIFLVRDVFTLQRNKNTHKRMCVSKREAGLMGSLNAL